MRNFSLFLLGLFLTVRAFAANPESIDLGKTAFEIESLTEGTVQPAPKPGSKTAAKPFHTTSSMTIRTRPGKKPGTAIAEIVRAKLKVESPMKSIDEDFSAGFAGKTFTVVLKNGLPQSIADQAAYAKALEASSGNAEFKRYTGGLFRADSARVTQNLMDIGLVACAKKESGKKKFKCTITEEIAAQAFDCEEMNPRKYSCRGQSKDPAAGATMELSGTVELGEKSTLVVKSFAKIKQPSPQGEVELSVRGETTRSVRAIQP